MQHHTSSFLMGKQARKNEMMEGSEGKLIMGYNNSFIILLCRLYEHLGFLVMDIFYFVMMDLSSSICVYDDVAPNLVVRQWGTLMAIISYLTSTNCAYIDMVLNLVLLQWEFSIEVSFSVPYCNLMFISNASATQNLVKWKQS
jgi:hypothetical protein